MVGRTLSHFRIVDKIGEGGMGVVYRAEDLDLGRQVALKVLHTEFVTDDERRRRFMREARTAASISHPNIATIHEVGESDGVIYIAMKLVEGRTLNQHIAENEPDIDECLRLAIQIGEGLASAHQANIVHRDLKPENVVIDAEARVNILDFGLAKLYGEPGESAGDSSGLQTISASVTRDGRILGTVQYMSPEQARGVELDARSDVFSLGIVLFEMVTGRLPFKGDTITDTLTSILRDEQPPIATFNPRVPVELERIIARCLEKDPQQRYQNAGEVLADLRRLKRTSDSQPVPLVSDTGLRRRRVLPWKRIAGFVAAAVLLVAIGAGAAGVLRSIGWLAASGPQDKKLAVLPFENLQERDDPERLGQILQELIITDLTGFESLKVLSSQRLFDVQKQLGRDTRTSIDRDMATRVAHEAGADVMLTGSLSRLGSTWILTCQLIDLEDGSVLQSDRIDGSDLYAMVDGLTEVVRRDLDVAPAEDLAVTQQTSSSLEAYQAYLAGVDALNSLDFPQAIRRFEEAVTVDPSFGKAYYKLAISRWWKSSLENFHGNTEGGTPSDALNRILDGDAKVPRKDRLLAEAFLELVESRPAEARPLFEKLVELYPDEKEAHYGLGEARFHSAGSSEDQMAALEPFERAIDLDPSFSLSFYHVVDLYIRGDRLDEGIRRVRGFIEEDPDNVTWYLDLARLARAKDDDALFERVLEDGMRRIDSRSDQRHYLVRLAMMTEDPDGREALLDRALAIETDAHQQDLLIALGNVAMDRREMDRAEALFHRAHEMDPRSQAGLNALFDFYHRSGRHDAALAEAKRLVGEDPEFLPYVGHWAAAAIVKGDPAETAPALEAFDAAIMRDPEDPGPMRTMGPMVIDARLRVEDYAHAEELLLRGLDVVDPAASGALYNRLGWVALELAKPAEAEDWFRRAYDRSIMKEGALAGLFQSALIRKEYDRAREHADKLDDLSRGKPWTRAMQIEVDIRAGRQREADRRTRETLEQIDDERERRLFLRELSEAHLAAGQFEQAVELGRQAKALDPADRPDGTTAVLLAWSLMNLDRAEEAGEVIQSATEEVPEDVRLDLLASFNALMEGEAELAERRATKILEQGPATASAHVALGYALGRQGRFAEAMPHAERALEMRPDRTSRTLAAWVLIAGGIDLDRGREMAAKAVDTPDSYLQAAREISCVALAEHCLGIAYLKQGRYDEAVEILTEASRIRPDHALIREQLEQATAMSMQSGS